MIAILFARVCRVYYKLFKVSQKKLKDILNFRYQTLSDFDMFKLPVRQLCAERTLILVWVTNKMRLQNFVKKQLFPKWNVEYLTD